MNLFLIALLTCTLKDVCSQKWIILSLRKKSTVPASTIWHNTLITFVIARSNKILTLRALLYMKPAFSMKSELSTTVLYTCTYLSVEVKLTGKAGWKSPLPTLGIFNRPWSQVRSLWDPEMALWALGNSLLCLYISFSKTSQEYLWRCLCKCRPHRVS